MAIVVLAVVVAASMAGCGNGTGAQASRQRLVFSDQFNAGSLDTHKWTTCYPWAKETGCTNVGNQELEWYTPAQVTVHLGALRLNAQRRDVMGTDGNGRAHQYPYRSGMVTTAGRFEFTYGFVEFHARAPRGRALWPALWLLPANQQWPPEVDVMEADGNDTGKVRVTYLRTPTDAPSAMVNVNDVSQWHTYALNWQPNSLTWYIDQRAVFAVHGDVPRQPMYLLANLAVDGRPQRTPDSTTPTAASFVIDHVRVWQSS